MSGQSNLSGLSHLTNQSDLSSLSHLEYLICLIGLVCACPLVRTLWSADRRAVSTVRATARQASHLHSIDQPPSWIYPQPRAKNKGRFLCCCPCVIILSCYRIYRKYSWPNSSASNFDIIFHRVTSDFLFYLGWPSIWAWHTFFISMMPHIISYHVIYFFLVGMAHFRSVISGLTWNGSVWVYHIFF